MIVMLVAILAVLLIPLAAFAQAATQPASVGFQFGVWLSANKVWLIPLIMTLIPTLITALSKFPQANGVVKVLQIIFDFFSILTHKDSPGTLKMPFTRSKPPGWTKPEKGTRSMPPVAGVILIPVLCLTLSSCCVFRGDCKSKPGQIATLVVDCSIEAVKTLATEMLPAVIAIVTSGGQNWSVLLNHLKEAGLDALACALQQAGQEVQNMAMKGTPMMVHPLVKMRTTPDEARARIDKYLSEIRGSNNKLYRVEFKR